MSLIATARAVDDERFLWRVRAAVLTVALQKVSGDDSPGKTYAAYMLKTPMGAAPPMEALVAANPVIAEAVVVDPDNGVNTEAVKDSDILFVVTDAWDQVAELNAVTT